MKASELRIGNLGQNHDGTLLKVIELREKYIGTQVIDRSKFPLPEGWQLEPIPLSEEWLLNLGFIKYQWCMDCAFIKFQGQHLMARYYSGKWHITKTRVKTDSGGQFTEGHKDLVKPGLIQFVHQLQNLFHALTGEELTLKTATASTTPKQTQ